MTRPTAAVPSTVDAIDTAWLTTALQAGGHLDPARSVVDADAAPVGNGLVCDSIRFELTYDTATDAPASVVCKLPSTDEGYRAAAVNELIYRRELSFYETVADTVQVRAPRCLHLAREAGLDVPFVLVLEDLGPAVAGDQVAGCSLEQARAVMDAAAALHAPLWSDPGLEDASWNVRPSWLPRVAQTYPGLFERYAREFGDLLDPSDIAIGEAFAPVIGAWFAEQPRPWTVAHGDFRLDNMLFDIRGGAESIGLLDWQTILPAPGTVDVAYFLGSCLSVDDRRAHEEELLARYVEGLQSFGVTDYDFDRCVRDYRYNAFLGYFMASYSPLLVKRTARSDEMFTTWLRRSAAQIRDHGSVTALPGR